MKENQSVEWKESWRDEYLKWVCGFANAEGGVLVIGCNNRGEVVGIENAQRLLEELPNKVRDLLGIMVDVYLRTDNSRHSLEIQVSAYPNPISYLMWSPGKAAVYASSLLDELFASSLPQLPVAQNGVDATADADSFL